jgi:hypothetical protein
MTEKQAGERSLQAVPNLVAKAKAKAKLHFFTIAVLQPPSLTVLQKQN